MYNDYNITKLNANEIFFWFLNKILTQRKKVLLQYVLLKYLYVNDIFAALTSDRGRDTCAGRLM